MKKSNNNKFHNILESWKRLIFVLECDIHKQKKSKKYFNVCILEILLFFISLPLHFYITPKAMPEYVKTIKGRKTKAHKENFCNCYSKKQRINYKILLIVVFLISLKIILGSIYIITKPIFLNAAVEDNTWDFSVPGEYSYDNSKIDVVGGVAKLKSTNLNILDDTQVEFDSGTYNKTQYNTDHLELELYEVVPDTNTLALYHFNETAGTILDSSINSNDATNNGAAQGVGGKIYNGISFDGSDDYLNISGDLGDPVAMTVSFWFNKPNINSGTDYIIDARDNGNWRLLQDSTAGSCSDPLGNICFNGLVEIPSSELSNNTWYHVAITANTTETKIYLNGDLINTGSGLNPSLGTDIRIGRRYNGSNYYQGLLDELVFWDKVLAPSEIEDHAKNIYKISGEFESNIFDAGEVVPWDEISWTEDLKAGDWYNSSWSKRRKVLIDNTLNSNTLTNYQVRLKINYSPDMKSDFSDLRFTDSDGVNCGDGSGLEQSRKENYESTKKKGLYVTTIVDSRQIVQEFSLESKQECRLMNDLVRNLKERLQINPQIQQKLTLDAGFIDRKLTELISQSGMKPFIFPKKGLTFKAKGSLAWKKMLNNFINNVQDWLKEYHIRSNVESFFSSIKRIFGIITKRTPIAINTQYLCRVIHNNRRKLSYYEMITED
jgi:hypothetical protein